MAFALYLTNIEARVLGVWCLYCVISQGIIAVVTLLSIGWVVWAAMRGKAVGLMRQASSSPGSSSST